MWPEGFYLGASGLHIQLGPPPAERHIPNLKTPGQDPTALTEGQGGRRARTVRSSEGLGEICPSSYLYSSRGCRTRPTGLGAPFPARIPKTPLKDHSRPNKTEKTTPAHPSYRDGDPSSYPEPNAQGAAAAKGSAGALALIPRFTSTGAPGLADRVGALLQSSPRSPSTRSHSLGLSCRMSLRHLGFAGLGPRRAGPDGGSC